MVRTASLVLSLVGHLMVAIAVGSLSFSRPPERLEISIRPGEGGMEIRFIAPDPAEPRPPVEWTEPEIELKTEHVEVSPPVPQEEAPFVQRPEPDFDRPRRIQRDRLVLPPPAVPAAPSGAEALPAAEELETPAPEYPALARRRGYEGTVVLAFRITPDGFCCEVRIQESCGHAILDNAALQAVSRWRYRPGNAPTEEQRVRIVFRLENR